MFKLIAIIYLSVNGSFGKEPAGVLQHNSKFATEQACMDYITTPSGEKDALQLKQKLASAPGETKVEYKCIEVEDNSI